MLGFKGKLMPLSLICLYPLVSTFLMTLIWQIVQIYIPHFMGGYYYKWVYLYTLNNTEWLSSEHIVASRIYYFIYIGSFLLLLILSACAFFARKFKPYFAWAICLLWLGDCGFMVWDLFFNEGHWLGFLCLAEHVIFVLWTVTLSVFCLRLRKTDPNLFLQKKKKRFRKKHYHARFR